MTGNTQTNEIEDLRFLYDLSIYNCRKYGPFKALIYEDAEELREYTNVVIAKDRYRQRRSSYRYDAQLPRSNHLLPGYRACWWCHHSCTPLAERTRGPLHRWELGCKSGDYEPYPPAFVT